MAEILEANLPYWSQEIPELKGQPLVGGRFKYRAGAGRGGRFRRKRRGGFAGMAAAASKALSVLKNALHKPKRHRNLRILARSIGYAYHRPHIRKGFKPKVWKSPKYRRILANMLKRKH